MENQLLICCPATVSCLELSGLPCLSVHDTKFGKYLKRTLMVKVPQEISLKRAKQNTFQL